MLDVSSKALPSLVLVAPSRAGETWFLPCRGAGGGLAGGRGSSVPHFLGGLSCSVEFLSLCATQGCVAVGAPWVIPVDVVEDMLWELYGYSVGFWSLVLT